MKTITDRRQSENQHAAVHGAELLAQAWRLRQQQDFKAAGSSCHRLLNRFPGSDGAWHLLGLVRWDQGERHEGIACLKTAIRLRPDHSLYFNTIGVMLIETADYRRAEFYLNAALQQSPDLHDARSNLGLVLFHQNKLDRAAHCFEQVLTAVPDHSIAWANLGMVRLAQGNFQKAAAAYAQAVALNPSRAKWQGNLAAAYLSMGKFTDAVQCYRQAISAAPAKTAFYLDLGVALRALGDFAGSIQALKHALVLSPSQSEACANLVIAYQHTCDWEALNPLYSQLDRMTRAAINQGRLPAEQPLLNIRRTSDLALNLSVARSWSDAVERRALKTGRRFKHTPCKPPDERITIAYLSYDFRDHPVAHQLLPLFNLHDRRRFRVKAFSMGPDDGSPYRRRIAEGCDDFIDISAGGMMSSAAMIYDHNVDILIDLMGHTHHNRMEILALRPAPLQVGYLGFLASSGAGFIDYAVTDKVVVPETDAQFYTEKLIWMPHCYQMNHDVLEQGSPPAGRRAWGLPEDAFVFCCFNQAYKIDGPVFDAWMRILTAVSGAVLWLCRDNPLAEGNLQKAARRHNVDPNRLIFADKVPLVEHCQRLQLADLALDTIGYNGGATTSNALWAGIPVLTVSGGHWVSRMSASHLAAAGVPELIADNLAAYERLAVGLAADLPGLQKIRDRLKRQRVTWPLFRTRRFVRDLERSFEMIWQRHLRRQPPEHIEVPLCGHDDG